MSYDRSIRPRKAGDQGDTVLSDGMAIPLFNAEIVNCTRLPNRDLHRRAGIV